MQLMLHANACRLRRRVGHRVGRRQRRTPAAAQQAALSLLCADVHALRCARCSVHLPQRRVGYCIALCAYCLLPCAEDPVCTDDGICFDVVSIVPYIRKHKKHPVSGVPLELKDLTRLHFHKNADGEYHCPVLNKARARCVRSRLLRVRC